MSSASRIAATSADATQVTAQTSLASQPLVTPRSSTSISAQSSASSDHAHSSPQRPIGASADSEQRAETILSLDDKELNSNASLAPGRTVRSTSNSGVAQHSIRFLVDSKPTDSRQGEGDHTQSQSQSHLLQSQDDKSQVAGSNGHAQFPIKRVNGEADAPLDADASRPVMSSSPRGDVKKSSQPSSSSRDDQQVDLAHAMTSLKIQVDPNANEEAAGEVSTLEVETPLDPEQEHKLDSTATATSNSALTGGAAAVHPVDVSALQQLQHQTDLASAASAAGAKSSSSSTGLGGSTAAVGHNVVQSVLHHSSGALQHAPMSARGEMHSGGGGQAHFAFGGTPHLATPSHANVASSSFHSAMHSQQQQQQQQQQHHSMMSHLHSSQSQSHGLSHPPLHPSTLHRANSLLHTSRSMPLGSSNSLVSMSGMSMPGLLPSPSNSLMNYNAAAAAASGASANSPHSPEPPIDPCNLIINYIPLTVTEDNLRELFSAYGSINRCKLVTDKFTGCSLGYGFVRFDDSTCAANAIASLNGYVIGSKQLKVSISKPPERERKTNLYISGLPTDWTQQHLEQLVTRFGQVNEVRVLTDPITRKGKGVGFARFDTIPAAAQCIQDLNGQTVDGGIMPLIVKYADTPADKMKKLTLMQQAAALHNPNLAHYLSASPTAAAANQQQQQQPHQPHLTALQSAPAAMSVQVTPNSPAHPYDAMRAHHAASYNAGYYGDVSGGGSVSPHSINSMGLYTPQNAASSAHTPLGSSLASTLAPPTPTSAHQHSQVQSSMSSNLPSPMHQQHSAYGANAFAHSNGGGQSSGGAQQHQHHASHQPPHLSAAAAALQQMSPSSASAAVNACVPVPMGIQAPCEFVGYCLFVYHLPLEASEQTLYQLFSNYATVTSAKIMRDLATGRSKGFGFVNVLTEQQAATAIAQLNGFQIGYKFLKVQMKTPK